MRQTGREYFFTMALTSVLFEGAHAAESELTGLFELIETVFLLSENGGDTDQFFTIKCTIMKRLRVFIARIDAVGHSLIRP